MAHGMYHLWRFIALAFTIVSLIAIPIPTGFTNHYAASSPLLLSVITSGFWFLSIFWNIFVISWEKARKEVIRPGSVVALDLVTWLYGAAMTILGYIFLVGFAYITSDAYRSLYSSSRYRYRYGYWNVSGQERNGTLACIGIYCACMTVSTILHFALFVLGCINEDRRRKAEKAAKYAGPTKGAGAPVMPQGNHPVEYYSAPGVGGGYAQPPAQAYLQNSSDKSMSQDEKQAGLEAMESGFGNEKR